MSDTVLKATGVLKVFEVFGFDQSDLDSDDAMILDAHHSVFVWLGSNATDNERKQGMRHHVVAQMLIEIAQNIAAEYMKMADDGRDTSGPVYVINDGSEPLAFTAYFHGWDSERRVRLWIHETFIADTADRGRLLPPSY